MSIDTTRDQPLPVSRFHRVLVVLTVVLGGCGVAYLGTKVIEMPIRYFVATLMGTVFLTLGMIFARRLSDVLLFLMIWCIPLLTFERTFMRRDESWVDFGMIGFNIGLLDIFLVGLYGIWALEVVLVRSRPLPRLGIFDWLILAYVGANALSLLTSASRIFTVFELFRVGKYALAYFYVAHRLERRHLKGILLGLLFALIFESALGIYQARTQKLVGIARSKGSQNEVLDTQYDVPEFEGHRRGEGTTIDSHALAVYFDLLLPYGLCLALAPWLPSWIRWVGAAAFCFGVPGLIATFARGGWGAFGIEVTFVFLVFAVYWREHRALRMLLVLALLAIPVVPLGGSGLLSKRIFKAPHEIMSARWDTVLMGYEIWKQNPFTGQGANAYLHAQRERGLIYDLSNDKPVHNTPMYVLAQMGIVGLVTYYALGIFLFLKCFTLIRWKDPLLSLLALAIAAGMVAIQADGMVDFMSFTNQDYFMQFLSCGLVAGMLPMRGPRRAKQFVQLEAWHERPEEADDA